MSEYIMLCIISLAAFFGFTKVSMDKKHAADKIITWVRGDITTQENIDAIVNPANEWLRHTDTLASLINDATEGKLQECCNTMPILEKGDGWGPIRCSVGGAVITPSFKLEEIGIKKIIHTVGPVDSDQDREKLLKSSYTQSLKLAQKNNLRRIAFPSISTGNCGYAITDAAPVAIKAVRRHISDNLNEFDEVRFVLYDKENYEVYQRLLKQKIQDGKVK